MPETTTREGPSAANDFQAFLTKKIEDDRFKIEKLEALRSALTEIDVLDLPLWDEDFAEVQRLTDNAIEELNTQLAQSERELEREAS